MPASTPNHPRSPRAARDDVLESMPEGLAVVDERGSFVVFNREAERLLGPRPGDVPPAAWPRHFGVSLHDGVAPCPVEAFPLTRAMQGEDVRELDLFVRNEHRPEGVWISGTARPVTGEDGRPHGAIMVFREVTTRKRAEEALRAERATLQRRKDRQGALAEAEFSIHEPSELAPLLERVTDLSTHLLPAARAAVVPLDPAFREMMKAIGPPPASSSDRGFEHPGAARWIADQRRPLAVHDVDDDPFGASAALREAGVRAFAGVPLTDDEAVFGVLFAADEHPRRYEQEDLDFLKALAARVAAAITKVRLYERLRTLNGSLEAQRSELARHREHLETLVAERTAELEASHRQLRLADRLASIGTLTAGLGHDMNNVLFPVRCRLDALDWSALAPDVADLLRSIGQSVEFLQQLTDGLRMFALDPEHAEGTAPHTEIADWWRRVSPLLDKAVGENQTLEGRIDDDLPAARVAPHRLTQAVLNLVVNASEAMPDGGVIRVRAARGEDASDVRISVADQGVGMSPDVRVQAFDPFFTTKKRGLSTGLGLSLVHGVAAASGGVVEIDSAPRRGTTVLLTLPASNGRPEGDPDARAPRGSAQIELGDPHAAAWTAGLLAKAGYRTPPGTPDDATLLVIDADPANVARARTFVEGRPGRRVMVLGAATAAWTALGAIVVEPARDLEALRAAIRRATAPAVEETT